MDYDKIINSIITSSLIAAPMAFITFWFTFNIGWIATCGTLLLIAYISNEIRKG